MYIDVLSRIIHVSTAIVLVGGSVFMLYVLMPVANRLGDSTHEELRTGIVARWKRFVHVGILLFLVTGLYNYLQAIPKHKGDGLYHALLGIKMMLALGVFFIGSALVGRSEKFAAIRAQRSRWLFALVLLAAVIVAISGFVKVRGSI